jgi:hypothetical protein
MSRIQLRPAIRAAAFAAGLLHAGAALAEQKGGSDQAAADCVNRAAVQLGIDEAACAVYPAYTPIYGQCRGMAAVKYAQALIACGNASGPSANAARLAGLRRTTAPVGRLSVN